VRELRNAIEHAMVLAEGRTIEREHLPESIRDEPRAGARPGIFDQLEAIERRRIMAALEAHGGNQTKAATALGMSRRALVYRLSRWKRS
jgi:DNA-binding NtrC family response regulator